MPNNVTPKVFGNLVDQLVTIEGRVPVMPQDVLNPMYEAARGCSRHYRAQGSVTGRRLSPGDN
jgi:hypothetical protein